MFKFNMYFIIKFIIFSSNLFYISFGNNINTYYVEDYCHYETINNKIHLNEDQSSILVRASRGSYLSDLDCQLRIGTDQSSGLNINVNYINLRSHNKFKDYLSIKFNENSSRVWFENKYIEQHSKFKTFYTTKSDNNDVVIKFTSTEQFFPNEDKGFELIITTYKLKFRDSWCPKFSFDCGNGICIQNKFRCNRYDNCGNNKDEESCKRSHNNNYDDFFETGFWFGFKIVLGLLLLGIFLGILSCICKNCDQRKKNQKYLYYKQNRYPGSAAQDPYNCHSIYAKQQIKAPLYPQLYRNYGGTEVY